MEALNRMICQANDFVWGWPLVILLLGVGILLTVRLAFVQLVQLPRALRFMFRSEKTDSGEVSSFGALCTALSATVGTGNIVGVATAVTAGGPGAVFWMWIAAFFGMATKFAEGQLAVKYRTVHPDGRVLGGPFYYIERGMGMRWRFLARLFALFGAAAALMGIGTFAQINSITSAVENVFDRDAATLLAFGPVQCSLAAAVAGIVVTLAAAGVILGGLKRIALVSKIIVPLMICVYLLLITMILAVNFHAIPDALRQIFIGAFSPGGITGGAVGSVFLVMQKGIARGIFSNESGQGSAPIVAAAAQTRYPTRQGLVSMTGTFIDTIIICTMTGLAIVVTSSWNKGLSGVHVTVDSFERELPFLPSGTVAVLLMLCIVFFAFTTCLGWSYYGERCLDYLAGGKTSAIYGYRFLYITAIFLAPWLPLEIIWNTADIFNGLMAIPNLIALICLSGITVAEAKRYFTEQAKNESEST